MSNLKISFFGHWIFAKIGHFEQLPCKMARTPGFSRPMYSDTRNDRATLKQAGGGRREITQGEQDRE